MTEDEIVPVLAHAAPEQLLGPNETAVAARDRHIELLRARAPDLVSDEMLGYLRGETSNSLVGLSGRSAVHAELIGKIIALTELAERRQAGER